MYTLLKIPLLLTAVFMAINRVYVYFKKVRLIHSREHMIMMNHFQTEEAVVLMIKEATCVFFLCNLR